MRHNLTHSWQWMVWHTGRALAWGALGPWFNSRLEQGIFVRPILICIREAHYSSGKAGWFSARTLSFHQCSGCMWIWFADSIPALVGFLRALRFPPTPKNRYSSIFLVRSFWSLVVCILPSLLVVCIKLPASGLITYVCAAAVTQRRLENPLGCKSRVTKTENYYYYFFNIYGEPYNWLYLH